MYESAEVDAGIVTNDIVAYFSAVLEHNMKKQII
jgi:hypothetical protein